MICLLDTCTFLWLADRTEELSPAARSTLEDPANQLVLSQVSSFEIQIKFNRAKIPLTIPPQEFISRALTTFGLTYLPIEDAHLWAKGKLPLLHRDPFDRLLIAQAIHEGMAIVTPDPRIHSYPVRALW